jgi:hypothetical protein
MVAIGGASLIGGLVQGNQASQDAKGARYRQRQMQKQKLDIAQSQNKRADTLFNRYMDLYAPAKKKVLNQAMEGVFNPNQAAGKAVAGIETAAEANQAVRQRHLRRSGVNPNSGRFAALSNRFAINKAAAEAGAANQARRQAVLENFDIRNQVSQGGNALIGQASQYAGQASRGLGDVAQAQGRAAGRAEGLAAGFGQQAGMGLGMIAGGLRRGFGASGSGSGSGGGLNLGSELDEEPFSGDYDDFIDFSDNGGF